MECNASLEQTFEDTVDALSQILGIGQFVVELSNALEDCHPKPTTFLRVDTGLDALYFAKRGSGVQRSLPDTVVNVVDSFVPTLVTAVMITSAIKAAIRPYSIAVAPWPSLRNRKKRFTDGLSRHYNIVTIASSS